MCRRATWNADPAHSSVAFEVEHMMTATVRCHFSSFDGTYRVRSDLTIRDETREVEVEATVQGAAEDPWGTEREGVAIHVVLVAIQPVLRTRPVDR